MRMTFVVMALLIGCAQSESAQPVPNSSFPITNLDIRSGPTAAELLEWAAEEERVASGGEWSLSEKDREQITAIVKPVSNEPIADIRITGPYEVTVVTGTDSGPLSGGGYVFKLKKSNGNWRIIDEKSFVS